MDFVMIKSPETAVYEYITSDEHSDCTRNSLKRLEFIWWTF